jgi:hypothetical protein
MLKEARSMRDKTIADAKEAASEEASKVLELARIQIDNEKKAAMVEVKTKWHNWPLTCRNAFCVPSSRTRRPSGPSSTGQC